MATLCPDEKKFLFLDLSGEIPKQIYQDIIRPEIPRTWNMLNERNIWPDRKFITALSVLNHILENVLSVEWTIQTYKPDEEEVRLFTSMKRLQRCKLVVGNE
ncbi:MAG: hypothetical protein Q9210_002241 [Variospora velana]